MARRLPGFVPIGALKGAAPSPDQALAEIRRIYFGTTRETIDNDFAHAVELLKSLPTEEEREKATVYMHGLSDMRREWEAETRRRQRGKARKPKR